MAENFPFCAMHKPTYSKSIANSKQENKKYNPCSETSKLSCRN